MSGTATIKHSIRQADADAMSELFQAVKDNQLWDKVYPHIEDAVIIAAEFIARDGLSTDRIERAANLVIIGELFLSYIHAGMEAEVSELPSS